MAALVDVMAYILKKYPKELKKELSNARVTKLVYLSDWHQAINFARQITTIDWYFDNYGPFVWDIKNEAEARNNIFACNDTVNIHGGRKIVLDLKDETYEPNLTENEKLSIDHVIDVTRRLYWDDFIQLVYSTHPIASSERYTYIDLVKKAEEYGKAQPTH